MSKRQVVVVAAIIFIKSKLLITQRNPNSHLAGYWEFPGGKTEPNETHQQALEREIKEETNLEIFCAEKLQYTKVDYPHKIIHLHFYRAHLSHHPQTVQCLDIADYRWITPTQLKDFTFPEADNEVIDTILGLKL